MHVSNVVQWLERQADELEITGSNPLESIPFLFFFVRIIEVRISEVRISEGVLYYWGDGSILLIIFNFLNY